MSSSDLSRGPPPISSPIPSPVDDIVASFAFSPDNVRVTAAHLLQQLRAGLVDENLPFQHPSYVTAIPDGSETGRFLSVDLGGTNCRICLVDLHGDGTFSVEQQKHTVPQAVRVNDRHEPLFDWMADQISLFLRAGQLNTEKTLPLGFTFSFTCKQTSLAAGTLLHWDKGWDIPTALGRDPCAMLQAAADAQQLPVRVAALANDSVGALLARAYTAGGEGQKDKATTLACIIVGTGTNAAYVERSQNDSQNGLMAMNTEWGCMDDDMRELPRTQFDDMVDARSTDRGAQMLEKRVSGLYLGELLRLAVVELYEEAKVFDMRVGGTEEEQSEKKAPMFRSESIDASFLSGLASDDDDDNLMAAKKRLLADTLGTDNVSAADVVIVQRLAAAIVTRAARLIGAATAAIVLQSGLLSPASSKNTLSWILSKARRILLEPLASCIGLRRPKTARSIIDIGVTGSVIEHHPAFEKEMRVALRQVPDIGPVGETRIQLSLCRDASAVGAALMVQAAMAQEAKEVTAKIKKGDSIEDV